MRIAILQNVQRWGNCVRYWVRLKPRFFVLLMTIVIVGNFVFWGQGCSGTTQTEFSMNPSADALLASTNPAFACRADTIAPTTIKRLTKTQYINSLKNFMSMLSVEKQNELLAAIDIDIRTIPLDAPENASHNNTTLYSRADNRLTEGHVKAIEDAAYYFSLALGSDNDASLNLIKSICGSNSTINSLTTSTCLQKTIHSLGRKAFRRLLTDTEKARFTAYSQKFTGGSEKLTALTGAFLAHPHFYYRSDNNGQLVAGAQGQGGTYRLNAYELVSKITFLFWSAPPNDRLLDLAATLKSGSKQDLASILEIVFADPQFRNGVVSDFYSEWLTLTRTPTYVNRNPLLDRLAQGGEGLATVTPDTAYREEMIKEFLDMTGYYSLRGNYEELMMSSKSFARTQQLANVYGVSTWNGADETMPQFPNSARRPGLLGRAAFLSYSNEYASAIVRGHRIRKAILCKDIDEPPADVPNTFEQLNTEQRLPLLSREITSAITSSGKCYKCHSQMNPLGFAAESFDSFGRHRTHEWKMSEAGEIVHRLPIQSTTTPEVTSGSSLVANDLYDLSQEIVDSGFGQRCMARQFFRFGQERLENIATDGCALESMRQQLISQDGSIRGMMETLVLQPTFQNRRVK